MLREKVLGWTANKVEQEKSWDINAVGNYCYTCGAVGHFAKIAPRERERASTAKVSTRVKVRVSPRALTKARARVSTTVKARALGGTRATGTKERAITAARWGTSVPSAGSIGRTTRTRFGAVDEQEEEAIEQVECQTCWMVGQVDEVTPPPEASWSRPRKVARRSDPALLLKYGPPGLGLRSAHGSGCADVCHNLFKVLDQEEDFDIGEVEEEPVNEVVDVTIDSGAGRNVWPKGKKVPGKFMPLKKKVKLVAANGSPIDVHGEKMIEFQVNGGRRCAMNYLVTGVKKPSSLGWGHRRWWEPSDL